MQKFIVLYCMPVAGLEDWQKIPGAWIDVSAVNYLPGMEAA